MTLCARGATTAENTRQSIVADTKEMLMEIMTRNNIETGDVISVVFSATKDLNAVYPAVAAREMGLTRAALFCVQEMDVTESLGFCVRVMMSFNAESAKSPKKQKDVEHIYLKGAKVLRPDLRCMCVAVDGTAHSGKSTATRTAARELNFTHLDTGATYRAAALYALKRGADVNDEQAVCDLIGRMNISLTHEGGEQKTILNGADVTELIRMPLVTDAVKITSDYTRLRKHLIALQRDFARGKNIIADGRDIGTAVFPDADLKIYMDADLDVRTWRRCAELARDDAGLFEEEREKLRKRDEADMSFEKRGESYLHKTEDAVFIDTTRMNEKAVSDLLVKLISDKLGE